MTVSHSTEPDDRRKMFAALSVMERKCPPLKHGRPPYWRAPITPPSADVYVPAWNWVSFMDYPQGMAVTVLDVNGAYLAALGSCEIAHSHLINTGRMAHRPEPRHIAPGYYRITVPYWSFSGTIVHPLGDSARLESERMLWVAAPTLRLLCELGEMGHIGHFDILDSWTAEVRTTFLSWAERLRSYRTELMDSIDMAQTEQRRAEQMDLYAAFKDGYSAALSMMLTGEKCLTRRPDWAHTIYAEHATNTWRKAWKYTFTGRPLISMGSVDEIAILARDLPAVLQRPKPPFRYDPSGRQLGAFKPKRSTFIGAESPQTPVSLHTADDLGDVL